MSLLSTCAKVEREEVRCRIWCRPEGVMRAVELGSAQAGWEWWLKQRGSERGRGGAAS